MSSAKKQKNNSSDNSNNNDNKDNDNDNDPISKLFEAIEKGDTQSGNEAIQIID